MSTGAGGWELRYNERMASSHPSMKQSLLQFIERLESNGMPVGFLRHVHRNYGLKWGNSNEVIRSWPYNNMYLKQEVLENLDNFSPNLPTGEGSSIHTVYHEATHAYIDSQWDAGDTDTKHTMQDAERHYTGGLLSNGTQITDPDRVAQEAAADYVAHRAASYWSALEMLTILRDDLPGETDPGVRSRSQKVFHDTVAKYDREMTKRTFGYQNSGSLWNKTQVQTREPIPSRLKDYCDNRILENKIPEHFSNAPQLVGMASDVRQLLR